MFDVDKVRSQFPSVRCQQAIFFDNPGGTQIVQPSLDRINSYLLGCNANHGGAFKTSIESDQILAEAHAGLAVFLNARSPDEIVFGPNMTTLTFMLSRSLAKTLNPGDEIIVTRLDHDANIAPWLTIAEDRGLTVRWVDIQPEDVTLDMEDLDRQLSARTRIVACGYASNAVGTINDVRAIAAKAHAVGALCFVDAVQAAPHLLMDVQDLDCDFLVCSAYKFFGPHLGVLYGRLDLLDRLFAYKVRPASDEPPGKFETGTQNHEGIAGTLGAVEYLEGLGRQLGARGASAGAGRRECVTAALESIRSYEIGLQRRLIRGLMSIPGVTIWGIANEESLAKRVPTVSFTLDGWHPRSLAARLAESGIYTWDGNYYALAVMERLGLQETGGMLRVGLVHYNTEPEIEKFLGLLDRIAGGS
ncbi:MAG: cysteine desulfurase-like protein [Acidobacteria bacterium]|nr:MAG: cysteine desulfurase-like protein [Acidobacteriota bacterium]